MKQIVPNPEFKLNNGVVMPGVGLGCWMGFPGGAERVENMVRTALKLGYRHFDTAAGYMNEEHVGKAIRESGIPRKDIFLTTKLAVEEAFEQSLKQLDCEYIDLYLMHWPQAFKDGRVVQPDDHPTFLETWKAMEKLLETGKIQLHPCLPDFGLLEYSKEKGIHSIAHTPLGRADAPFFSDETTLRIGKKYGVTVGQVLLSWGYQRGTSVIPKSENEERLRSNLEASVLHILIKLDDEDVETLNEFHKKPGMHKQLIVDPRVYDTENGTAFGWTYEQMGWNLDKKGSWMQ
ncbi:hypothetical protein FRB99_007076 [Tulasnella sp. 403]|nr:hypothetical protein FRB99_007076 [Tulasnella sp. 403]